MRLPRAFPSSKWCHDPPCSDVNWSEENEILITYTHLLHNRPQMQLQYSCVTPATIQRISTLTSCSFLSLSVSPAPGSLIRRLLSGCCSTSLGLNYIVPEVNKELQRSQNKLVTLGWGEGGEGRKGGGTVQGEEERRGEEEDAEAVREKAWRREHFREVWRWVISAGWQSNLSLRERESLCSTTVCDAGKPNSSGAVVLYNQQAWRASSFHLVRFTMRVLCISHLHSSRLSLLVSQSPLSYCNSASFFKCSSTFCTTCEADVWRWGLLCLHHQTKSPQGFT